MITITLGEKIRQLRTIRNLSLREFSKVTGLSKTTLSDIENNKTNPSLDTLNKIANSIGVNISMLINLTITPTESLLGNCDSSILTSLSKSKLLIQALYHAESLCVEDMDQLAIFIESYLIAKEKLSKL